MTSLVGAGVRALDGAIGSVRAFLFDDAAWTVRYVVVDTGGWLPGREVLISPRSCGRFDPAAGELVVRLDRERIARAPGIETDRPVSRQREAELNAYYGYPAYWSGPYLWGAEPYPVVTPEAVEAAHAAAARIRAAGDPHLRSTAEVIGYAVRATDGPVGHVDDFLVADDTWTIRYLDVDTKPWWPGGSVLVPPWWVEDVRWAEREIVVPVDRDTVRRAPAYDGSAPLAPELDAALARHYESPDTGIGAP